MIVKAMQVGAIGTNCYLLGDETHRVCAIVDPGDDAPSIRQMIGESGLELELLLLTHGHYDHTTAIAGLRETWPEVPVYIHKGDYCDAPKTAGFQLGRMDHVQFYEDGDTVKLGELTIEVIATPGHSVGSVTLKVEDVLFTGDTLFRGSMGRTDLDGGNYEEIMRSLKKLATLPGDYNVCPGHEGMSTLETERKNNFYLREALLG